MPRRRRAPAGALLALAAAFVGPAAGQVTFQKAPAPDYLTYCFEAATGLLPSAGCNAGTYNVLQQAITEALNNPTTFDPDLLNQMEAICEADCVGELLTIVRDWSER